MRNVSETKDCNFFHFSFFSTCVRARTKEEVCLDFFLLLQLDVVCLRRMPHAVHVLAAVLRENAFFVTYIYMKAHFLHSFVSQTLARLLYACSFFEQRDLF